MCGIIGAIAKNNVVPTIVKGLQLLEYRGYDSAGIAVVNNERAIARYRVLGKVEKLVDKLNDKPLVSHMGVGHTRWATHGKPAVKNAHPLLSSDKIIVVHNGIIENHQLLRARLTAAGYHFTSDTDTEVIAHLIHQHLLHVNSFLTAVQNTADELEGAFAIAAICSDKSDRIIGLRRGSPLVIGLGEAGNYFASDQLALLPVAQKFIYLEDKDLAEITANKVMIFANYRQPIQRSIRKATVNSEHASKGDYPHYMIKEIEEQPRVLAAAIESRVSNEKVFSNIFGADSQTLLSNIKRIKITACGTSYHAGLAGRYWLEELADIVTQVEIASEYRYRHPAVDMEALFVALSQSGETIDTLAALRSAKNAGYLSNLAICNVPESSLVREAELAFLTQAGPEISVAFTKAFTSQLVALLLLTILLGRYNNKIHPALEAHICQQLHQLPAKLTEVFTLSESMKQLASLLIKKQHVLFVARGIHYPIALEGALKLKEISYIHAEAYAAGELKHGTLALVDKETPIIALAPSNELLDKVKANISEIQARGGNIYVFTDNENVITANQHTHVIQLPLVDKILQPFVFTLPLQLLAYHAAVLLGRDVDKPRNLAKSVTVE
jgi:glucosamine--fructose-6-phosphate aminotransferase (isomerizing)